MVQVYRGKKFPLNKFKVTLVEKKSLQLFVNSFDENVSGINSHITY